MASKDLASVRAQYELLTWVAQRKKELKDLEDAAKSAIQEALGSADTGELDGKPVISWTTYKKRQFDQKALKESHPEVAEAYTKLVEVRTFRMLEEEGN